MSMGLQGTTNSESGAKQGLRDALTERAPGVPVGLAVVIVLIGVNAPLRVQRLIKPRDVWPTDSTESMPETAPVR